MASIGPYLKVLIRGRLLYDNITGCPSADQYFVCLTLKLIHSEKPTYYIKNICFVASMYSFVSDVLT